MPRRITLYSLLDVPRAPAPSSPPKFDPAHKYVTSPLFRNPFIFGGLRLLSGVYTLTTTIYLLVRYCQWGIGGQFFSYFTHLSYIGLTAYFIASGVQTISYASRWKRNGAGAGFMLQRWPRVLQACHVVLYTTVVTYPFIVTIVYWTLLSSPGTFDTASSSYTGISIHALNLFLAICEIVFSNSPPLPWIALPLTILGLGGYLGVAYITYETQGFYSYSFLDPSEQGSLLAAYIVGIAAGQCVVFTLVHFVIVLRQRIALKYKRVLRIDDDSDDSDLDSIESDGQRISGGERNAGSGEGDQDDARVGEEWEDVEYPVGAPAVGPSPGKARTRKVSESPRKSGRTRDSVVSNEVERRV